MLKEILQKKPKDLSIEDVQYLADAPLSVTTDYHKIQDIKKLTSKLRKKLPKLMKEKARISCTEQLDLYEKQMELILQKHCA